MTERPTGRVAYTTHRPGARQPGRGALLCPVMNGDDLLRLTYLGLLLAVLAPGILAWNLREKATLRNAAIWLALAAAAALLAKTFGDFAG